MVVPLHGLYVDLARHSPTEEHRFAPGNWQPVQPDIATGLTDARLQFHHAAQFATAGGISFLPPEPDDSHTNLEWVPEFQALFSRLIPAKKPFRLGARPAELALLILPEPRSTIAECRLNRCTIDDAMEWVRSQLALQGADAERYSLERHYEIPSHPVATGGAFDAKEKFSFDELSRWFANGATVLSELARLQRAGDVRCWPHHFDIGMLIQLSPDRSIGVGLEPGDDYYGEPYFYVNMTPQPMAARIRSSPLAGDGTWHTRDWIGAVLPGSRLGTAPTQEAQVRAFLNSAVAAARKFLATG